jgi:hypothetical protein
MRANRRIAIAILPDEARAQGTARPQPLPRCHCGQCSDCRENDRWERIFARLEVKQYGEERGLFQSTLRGL